MNCNKKRIIFIFNLVTSTFLLIKPSCSLAGEVIPRDIIPSHEQIEKLERSVIKIGMRGGTIKLSDKTRMSISQKQLSSEIAFDIVSFNKILKEKALEKEPSYLPIIGIVKIFIEDLKQRKELEKKELNIELTIPLIIYKPPGTRLEVVKPNMSSTDWAKTGLFAIVGEDGMTATFTANKIGMYGLFIRGKKQLDDSDIESPYNKTKDGSSANTDSYYGMHQVEGLTEGTYPLILVHGNESEDEELDSWGNFIAWAKENTDFKSKFMVWRFHHDSSKPIGFDGGSSSNAQDLKDGINKLVSDGEIGANEQVLLLAYSRGGLVSRAYMQKYDGGEKVMGLLTLATPHHGSVAAIPDWGYYTTDQHFIFMDWLAVYFWGPTNLSQFNYYRPGSHDLGWDNFDGSENGIIYDNFILEWGFESHTVSVKDTNMANPVLEAGQSDSDIHGKRSYGYLDALNSDSNLYLDKVIAYGGYDPSFEDNALKNISKLNIWNDHTALSAATVITAEFDSKNVSNDIDRHYIANDGVVPLQSALFLKKDSKNEPIYNVEEVDTWYSFPYYKITGFKDFSSRVQVKKVRYEEFKNYDHFDMVEGRTSDKDTSNDYDLFNYILADLSSLAGSLESITHTITAPSKTSVSQGSLFGPFTIEESNNSSSYYAFYIQPYVTKPDGITVNFKQVSTGLKAGETRKHSHYLNIPASSELGTFTFGVKITDTNGNLIDDDAFEFTVVSSSSSSSINKKSARRLKRLMRKPDIQVLEEDGWNTVIVPE